MTACRRCQTCRTGSTPVGRKSIMVLEQRLNEPRQQYADGFMCFQEAMILLFEPPLAAHWHRMEIGRERSDPVSRIEHYAAREIWTSNFGQMSQPLEVVRNDRSRSLAPFYLHCASIPEPSNANNSLISPLARPQILFFICPHLPVKSTLPQSRYRRRHKKHGERATRPSLFRAESNYVRSCFFTNCRCEMARRASLPDYKDWRLRGSSNRHSAPRPARQLRAR